MAHRRRRPATRHPSHPDRPARPGGHPERPVRKGEEKRLAALDAERRPLVKPLVAMLAVDVLLMAAGPLCAVVPLPFACDSLRDQNQIWGWFVVMLIVNALIGSVGGKFVRLTFERRRLSREVRTSTS